MAGGHTGEGEKQLCQMEVDGCPSQMDGGTALLIAFIHHRTFIFLSCCGVSPPASLSAERIAENTVALDS